MLYVQKNQYNELESSTYLYHYAVIEGILNNTCKFIYHGPNTTQTSTLVQGGGTKGLNQWGYE